MPTNLNISYSNGKHKGRDAKERDQASVADSVPPAIKTDGSVEVWGAGHIGYTLIYDRLVNGPRCQAE